MRFFVCRGCIHADIHVTSNQFKRYNNTTGEYNALSIFCKKTGLNVKYPYEKCPDKEERLRYACPLHANLT